MKAPHAAVIRYEPDAKATVVGTWRSDMPPLGSRWPLDKGSPAELVARTKAPGRIDAIEAPAGAGELLTVIRAMGINSAVGCPIMVGGRLWGAVIAGSTSEPLPEDTEERMVDFTDLLVAAIANAESYAKLEASRARVLAAADATRRLIERDLHDGTQQRRSPSCSNCAPSRSWCRPSWKSSRRQTGDHESCRSGHIAARGDSDRP